MILLSICLSASKAGPKIAAQTEPAFNGSKPTWKLRDKEGGGHPGRSPLSCLKMRTSLPFPARQILPVLKRNALHSRPACINRSSPMGTLTNFAFEILEAMKKLMNFYKTAGFWDEFSFTHKSLNVVNGSDKMLESLILYLEELKAILDKLYVEKTSRAIDQEVLKLMDSNASVMNNRQCMDRSATDYSLVTSESYFNGNVCQSQNPANTVLYYYFQPTLRKDLMQEPTCYTNYEHMSKNPPETKCETRHDNLFCKNHPGQDNSEKNLLGHNENYPTNNIFRDHSIGNITNNLNENNHEGDLPKVQFQSTNLDTNKICRISEKHETSSSETLKHIETKTDDTCDSKDLEPKVCSQLKLDMHNLENSGGKMYCCEQCGKLLSSKRNLISHLTRMHEFNTENALHCPDCGRVFTRKFTLETHMARHKGIKPFSCHICHKNFAQKITRDVHLVTHTGNYEFSCDKCLRKFSTKYKLKFHLKSHVEEMSVSQNHFTTQENSTAKCAWCNLTFSSNDQLLNHNKIEHIDDNLYVCVEQGCKAKNKSFLEKQLLEKHNKRYHSSKIFFTCEYCNASYMDKKSLRHHIIRKHSNMPKPYHKCLVCGKGFTLMSKLNRHFKIHTEEPKFRCDVCGKKFHRSDALKQHMSSHEKTETTCTICDKKFKNIDCLSKHMGLHMNLENTCLHCGKTFSDKFALEYHLARHEGNFKFICETCGKGFVRKCHYDSHIGSHSLMDTYECSICEKGFKDLRYCKRHIKRLHKEGEPREKLNKLDFNQIVNN